MAHKELDTRYTFFYLTDFKKTKSFLILNNDKNESLCSFINITVKTKDATKYDKHVE